MQTSSFTRTLITALPMMAVLTLSTLTGKSDEPGNKVPVIFSGGHETVPVDHGRPVILIAAALGVKDEVFRETFTHVHPAGPGSGGPTDAEARQNKKALMDGLGKYGVTNDRLNTVSNFYRYPPGRGNVWRNKPAAAYAILENGTVKSIVVTDPGYGYTTTPTVTVPNAKPFTANVQLGFGKEFESNGSVTGITIQPK